MWKRRCTRLRLYSGIDWNIGSRRSRPTGLRTGGWSSYDPHTVPCCEKVDTAAIRDAINTLRLSKREGTWLTLLHSALP